MGEWRDFVISSIFNNQLNDDDDGDGSLGNFHQSESGKGTFSTRSFRRFWGNCNPTLITPYYFWNAIPFLWAKRRSCNEKKKIHFFLKFVLMQRPQLQNQSTGLNGVRRDVLANSPNWHTYKEARSLKRIYQQWCFCRLRDEGDSSAYDTDSSSVIKLNNSTILYLREVNK